mmetsp:Transcript_20530/g.51372  ORF Transcript_20530/g.51372 Transcript_20530/m.51372 type:complete len:220 (+) Transcript_20530:750-1409(+)
MCPVLIVKLAVDALPKRSHHYTVFVKINISLVVDIKVLQHLIKLLRRLLVADNLLQNCQIFDPHAASPVPVEEGKRLAQLIELLRLLLELFEEPLGVLLRRKVNVDLLRHPVQRSHGMDGGNELAARVPLPQALLHLGHVARWELIRREPLEPWVLQGLLAGVACPGVDVEHARHHVFRLFADASPVGVGEGKHPLLDPVKLDHDASVPEGGGAAKHDV